MSLNEKEFENKKRLLNEEDAKLENLRRERNRQALESIIDGSKPARSTKKKNQLKRKTQVSHKIFAKKRLTETHKRLHDLRDALRDSFTRLTQRKSSDQQQTALVPEASVSGRALIIVIIIMTFLASITAGAVEMISSASSGWSTQIAQEMTIQIRPKTNRNIETDLATAEKLARDSNIFSDINVYTKAQSERLLEPWLGANLNLEQIPVPRIMVLKIKTDTSLNITNSIQTLKQNLNTNVPTATLDDHRQWSSRLSTMAGTMVFSGIFILMLVLVATALAIGFATRGAMAGTREIINVLHLVGAEDRFIADEFQRHFLKLGARGGIIGGFLAIFIFFITGKISNSLRATPQGDQIEALFGSFNLGLRGFAAIFAIMLLVAALTAIITRVTVYRNLRGLD
jgi:cell division transport system permease protein